MTPDPETVRVLAAGSLRRAFAAIEAAFRQAAPDVRLQRRHGPAGLLRAEIERGAGFDVFASADMGHPARLAAAGRATAARRFARNGFVATVRLGLEAAPEALIDVMLDPAIRLATSTPGADPSGDYAETFFDAVERAMPGKGERLRAKALRLVGGPASPPVPEGRAAAAWLIATGQADIMLGYASYAAATPAEDGVAVLALPADLAPRPEYGLCLSPSAPAAACRFADFLLSPPGQAILIESGFGAAD